MAEKCFCHLNGYAVKDATARKKIADLEKLSVNNFEPFTKTGDNVVKFKPLENSRLNVSVFLPPLQDGRGVPTPGNYRHFVRRSAHLDIAHSSQADRGENSSITIPLMFPCGGTLNITNGTLAAMKHMLVDGGVDGLRVSSVDHVADSYRGWVDPASYKAAAGTRVFCSCLPNAPHTVYGDYRVGYDDDSGRIYVMLHEDQVNDQENGIDPDGVEIPGSTDIVDKFNRALLGMYNETDIGVEIVYEPEDPEIYTLDPVSFSGLEGENAISVDYYVDEDTIYPDTAIITVSGTSSTLREGGSTLPDDGFIEFGFEGYKHRVRRFGSWMNKKMLDDSTRLTCNFCEEGYLYFVNSEDTDLELLDCVTMRCESCGALFALRYRDDMDFVKCDDSPINGADYYLEQVREL